MEIKFGGTFELATFQKAIELAQRPSRTTQATRWLFAGLLVFLLGYLALDLAHNPNLDATRVFRVVIPSIIIVYLLARPAINTWQVTRRIARSPNPRELSGKISDQGFEYNFMRASAEVPWQAITQKRQVDDLVVLLIAHGGVFFFPRSLFQSDADWSQFLKTIEVSVLDVRK